jgi:nucleoside-diphosphate-sugar epimerase
VAPPIVLALTLCSSIASLQVYQEHIIDVARVTAAAAKKAGVQRFVQVSTGQVYDASKVRACVGV